MQGLCRCCHRLPEPPYHPAFPLKISFESRFPEAGTAFTVKQCVVIYRSMKTNLSIVRQNLDGLVAFAAVAETLNFREAALLINVTPSAVSQAVRRLERRLEVPLLIRTTRKVALLEAGQILLDKVRPAIDLLSTGMDTAKEGSAK